MQTFPKPIMLPGQFLGITCTAGDAFTFYILTNSEKGRDAVLTYIVMMKWSMNEPVVFTGPKGESIVERTITQVDQLWPSH